MCEALCIVMIVPFNFVRSKLPLVASQQICGRRCLEVEVEKGTSVSPRVVARYDATNKKKCYLCFISE